MPCSAPVGALEHAALSSARVDGGRRLGVDGKRVNMELGQTAIRSTPGLALFPTSKDPPPRVSYVEVRRRLGINSERGTTQGGGRVNIEEFPATAAISTPE